MVRIRTSVEVFFTFLKLGLTSFGGPVAHLGYLRAECVERRQWLDDATYADLVALCQFLPGPASSQVVFAIGMQRARIIGALLASIGFLLPSAALMIAFAYGVTALPDLHAAKWLHGLKLAAVAVVAQAVWAMGKKLCPDRARLGICLLAACVMLLAPGPVSQVAVIAVGALAGYAIYRDLPAPSRSESPARARWHIAALVIFLALLALSIEPFAVFYRAGALVFGGGHVVLPLLRNAIVLRGWMSDDAFLAGYGAAQAVPGPLFSFAGYLGALIWPARQAWAGGLLALLAIFLPSWLLVYGALPFWHQLREKVWAQAALRGANAAVVGLLLSALYSPVMTEGVKAPRDFAAVLVAFGLLELVKTPPWAVVMLSAATAALVQGSV